MANEVSVTVSLTAAKNNASIRTGGVTEQITMAGEDMFLTTISILSSGWNAISMGSITGVPSKVFIKNLDSTNYFEMATDNAGANKFIKCVAGAIQCFTPSSATIYVKANIADVKAWWAATEL